MQAIRSAVGKETDIAIDLNFNFTPDGNVRIAHALEPLDLAWIEFDSYDPESLLLVKNQTRIPYVQVKRFIRPLVIAPSLRRRAFDIAMLDIPVEWVHRCQERSPIWQTHTRSMYAHTTTIAIWRRTWPRIFAPACRTCESWSAKSRMFHGKMKL